MCMGCMTNADFVLTSGLLGAAGVRVGARQLFHGATRWTRKVTDEEALAFVASLAPPAPKPAERAEPAAAEAGPDGIGHGAPAGTHPVMVRDRVVMPVGDRVLAGR